MSENKLPTKEEMVNDYLDQVDKPTKEGIMRLMDTYLQSRRVSESEIDAAAKTEYVGWNEGRIAFKKGVKYIQSKIFPTK